MAPISIFYSYAPEDESLCIRLEKHLSLLRQQNLLTEYHRRKIAPGTDWSQVVDAQISTASVILLLISSDFLASDYCYGVEMQKALERHQAGTAHVIPVLLRSVDWHGAPFAHLRCLPSNKIPIMSWTNHDEAFRDVATGIRTLLENVYGIPSQQAYRATSSMSRDHRTRMLKQVRTFWIDGVLERSLHHMALITLGLHEHPDAVTNPWRLVMQEAERPAYSLPVGTRITDVYDKSDGKLLVLGKPGAGKTTLLLELARDLLDRAEQDRVCPVPVVFHLSSWTEKETSLAHWLVNELQSKYQLSRKVGQDWINTDKVLLLLDGLDEVPQNAQSSCIKAINSYHQEYNLVSIVLCSRSVEYFAQTTPTTRVALQTAVEIQPLTEQQVSEYLLSAGKQLEALRFVLSRDSILREISTTPLMLSIMSLAYSGKDVKDIVVEDSTKKLFEMSFPVLTAQSREVFKTYVQEMLHRRRSINHFSSQEVVHWLTWVAKNSFGAISPTLFRYPKEPRILTCLTPVMVESLPFLLLLLVSFGGAALNLFSAPITLLGLELLPSGLMILAWLRYVTSGGESSKVGVASTTIIYSDMIIILIYMGFALFFSERWLIILLGIAALLGGGTLLWVLAMLLYLSTRVRLYLNGDIPWDYRTFLHYATEHALLYKTGDRYIFIHDLLRDYFRSLDATD